MKRALLLLACPLLFLMPGCSAQPEAPTSPLAEHTGHYETAASISYRDLDAEAVISQGSPSSCSLSFTSPASLSDLAFVFRQDTVDISYKGLSYTVDPGTLPGNAVASMSISAINAAMQGNGVTLTYEEDVLLLTGTMETGEFLLRLDAESGNLIKLSIPAEELEIEFLNFRFLD